jgi:hypothetical protein
VGLTTLLCKKEIVEKPPRNSAGLLWRRPRPKLGCGAKERRTRRYNKVTFRSDFIITRFSLF